MTSLVEGSGVKRMNIFTTIIDESDCPTDTRHLLYYIHFIISWCLPGVIGSYRLWNF